MSRFLPLFPLGLVVYPGEELRLHIFEPRYKQLIRECEEDKLTFGIPSVIEKDLSEFATEMQLASIDKKYDGGELDVTAIGLGKVRILDFQQQAEEKLYPGGLVKEEEDLLDQAPEFQEKIFSLMGKLNTLLGIRQQVVAEPAEITAYKVGHSVGFGLAQEYELLSIPKESARLKMIADHLEKILPVIVETQRMKMRALMNGHHKNVLPPGY